MSGNWLIGKRTIKQQKHLLAFKICNNKHFEDHNEMEGLQSRIFNSSWKCNWIKVLLSRFSNSSKTILPKWYYTGRITLRFYRSYLFVKNMLQIILKLLWYTNFKGLITNAWLYKKENKLNFSRYNFFFFFYCSKPFFPLLDNFAYE